MATYKEQNKLNVPHLRFPEFHGEWEKCKLGELAVKVGSGSTPKGGNAVYTTSGHCFVRSQNVGMGHLILNDIAYIDESTHQKQKSTELRTNDVLLNITGASIGRTALATEEINGGNVNQHVCIIRTNGNVEPSYICDYIQTSKIQKYIQSLQTGGSREGLNFEQIRSFPINIPTVEEQVKIAKLLSLINERIATQSKLIEDLKKLKSAIVEKVFCSPNQEYPMCRIEGFEQALSTYKMSDFSSRIATKNKDSKCSLVLTIAAQYGLVNQESFFNKSVASENLTGYYLLHKGEFAYNRSYSAGYDWGTVKRLDNYDEGVLSTLYICFKTNETIVDSDYLAYYFESTKWHRGLSDIAGEGARNHGLLNVSMADYFNTKHRFPVIEEQKTIAKILNAITEKERKATMLGECYQKQKQYLLCQMFT
ncbi:restriction endonuclease subunit S [Prevotella copri]|nr:restriction endonuclease subunit S [Segatella copri]MQM46903.1 restriction endonuclease subunit S [Segatella copri]MQM98251.1 restriction endonuclease subunit S [Segatella copri]